MSESVELTNAVVQTYPTWVNFLAPGAVIISVIGASIWANRSILAHKESAKQAIDENRIITKQRSTMDFIMQRSRDEKFFRSFMLLRDLHFKDDLDIKLFADANKEIDLKDIGTNCKDARGCISYVLNQYEYMSTGIQSEIYDEEMLIESSKTSTISVFDMTKPFIDQLRQDLRQKTGKECLAYANFEVLAKRWKGL